MANKAYQKSNPEISRRFKQAVQESVEHLERNPAQSIYTLERNAKLLGFSGWRVSKVTAERAGELVGKLELRDISGQDLESRKRFADAASEWSTRLQKVGYLGEPANVPGWIQQGSSVQ